MKEPMRETRQLRFHWQSQKLCSRMNFWHTSTLSIIKMIYKIKDEWRNILFLLWYCRRSLYWFRGTSVLFVVWDTTHQCTKSKEDDQVGRNQARRGCSEQVRVGLWSLPWSGSHSR